MKYVRLLMLLLCAVPGTPYCSLADHGLGAEIHYKQLATDTYLVTVIMYRDCNGTTFTNPTVTVTDASTSKDFTLKTGTTTDITPIAPGGVTRCKSSTSTFAFGIQQCTYTGKIYTGSLHAGCLLRVWFYGYPRPGTITTGASYDNSYYEATINRCAGPNNSTPAFTSPPLLLVPIKEITYYNPGAVDTDLDSAGNRDSLVYSLTPSLKDSNSSNNWTGSYGYRAPIDFVSFPKWKAKWNPPTSPGGFHFDSLTGDMYFKSTSSIISLLTYSVFVYGKNKLGMVYLKGITNRSIVISSLKVPPSHEPDLGGINGGTSFDTTVIPNSSLCFKINSTVADTSDSVHVSWNNTISGASFGVTSGVKHPVATFCWTPDSTKLSTYPYEFVVKAEDNASSLSARAYKSYRVYVKPPIVYSPVATNCIYANFSVLRKPGSGEINKYEWYGDDSLTSGSATFTHHYKKPGTYKFYLKASNDYTSTLDSGTITITTPLLDVHVTHDTSICQGSSLLVRSLTSGGKGAYTYAWSNGDTNSALNVKVTRDIQYHLLVKDAANCIAMDSINVHTKSLPAVKAGSDSSVCKSSSAFSLFALHPSPLGGIWSGKAVRSDSLYPKIAAVGKNNVSYTFTDTNQCADSASAQVTILAGPAVPVISQPANDRLVASDRNVSYAWYKDSVSLSLYTDSIYVNRNGNYTVTVMDSSGCIAVSTPYSFTVTAISGEADLDEAIKLYPNPSNGLLTLETKGKETVWAELQNNLGQHVMSFNISGSTQSKTLDMHLLPAGIYLLHINTEKGSYVQKVILKK